MRRDQASLLAGLSAAEIKKLLANMKKIETVLARKAKLESKLDTIERELAELLAAADKPRRGGRPAKKRAYKKKAAKKKTAKKRAAKKKTAKKKATKKKAAKKRVARKKVAKKVAKRKVAKKRTTKKTKKKSARKKTVRKAARRKTGRSQATLEEVVAGLIRRNGGPLAFQEILKTITTKKLFASKSKNFDNVLRRTLSTSDAVKRVSRGVYDLA